MIKLLSPVRECFAILLMAFLLVLNPQADALDMERLLAAFGRYHPVQAQAFSEWQKLMRDAAPLPATEKLKQVNEFFNRRVAFDTDQDIWGQTDYWATPLETLARSRGDCEDFVIAKYFTLQNLGISDAQLRLIYVKARLGGPSGTLQQAHMVLAYYPTPDADPLVLDNLITDIRPAARRSDLLPVFSFNSQGIYSGVDARVTTGTGGVGQLSRWSDLLRRARAEGFD